MGGNYKCAGKTEAESLFVLIWYCGRRIAIDRRKVDGTTNWFILNFRYGCAENTWYWSRISPSSLPVTDVLRHIYARGCWDSTEFDYWMRMTQFSCTITFCSIGKHEKREFGVLTLQNIIESERSWNTVFTTFIKISQTKMAEEI